MKIGYIRVSTQEQNTMRQEVLVESISRFARNTKDLLELVEQLTAKGVEFISQKEAIDTTTPTGKFMLTIFGAVAELEREYILQRQREGIAIAKEQGKIHWAKTGRTSKFLQGRGTDEKYHKYIGPVVGKMRLRDVRDIQLQSILNEQRGMSFSHVTKLRMVMQELFHQAYRSMFTRQWKVEQTL